MSGTDSTACETLDIDALEKRLSEAKGKALLSDEMGEWRSALTAALPALLRLARRTQRAEADREKLRKELEWQPIETAPKDGREVLLVVKFRAGIRGKCLVGHYMRGGHCIEDHPPIGRGWYFWNGCMFDLAAEPTHWAPLPPTPEEAKEEAKP